MHVGSNPAVASPITCRRFESCRVFQEVEMQVHIRQSKTPFDHRAFAHDVIVNRLYVPGWNAHKIMKRVRRGEYFPSAIWAARDNLGINQGWLLAECEGDYLRTEESTEEVLIMMFVRKRHRRKGIGRGLLSACRRHFPDKAIGGFEGTEGGRAFYEREDIPYRWHW